MIEKGGLHTIGDVKALILYILYYAKRALNRENLTEIVLSDDLVEYFDFTQALQGLLEDGLVDIASPEDDNSYVLTTAGAQTEELYEKNLPFNVKKKNLAAMTRVLAQIRRNQSAKADIEQVEHGYLVTCTLTEDNGSILLRYTVLVPDELQAHMIADQFKTHPTEKYQSFMSLLIDENLFDVPQD